MEEALFIARLLLAGAFAVAGLAKLADRPGSLKAVADFGVPRPVAAPVAWLLPLAELTVAVLLLPDATAVAGAAGAIALLTLFVAGISVNLARGRTPDCHCFGQIHSAPAGWSTLARNIALAGLAVVVAVEGPGDVGGLVAWIGELRTGEAVALVLAVALLALVLLEAWVLTNTLRQNGRMLLRLDAIEAGLREHGIRVAPITPAVGLPVGSAAPAFELPSLDGEAVSLNALRRAGKPVALIFSDPGCGPCKELLPEIASWQRDGRVPASIAMITTQSAEENRPLAAEHGLATILLQRDHEVLEAYEAAATPSAVVVGADGLIASNVATGPQGIRELMTTLDREEQGLAVGKPAPELRLPGLEGEEVALSDLRGEPVLLLFWSPSCGFCQRMLPDLKLWELRRAPGTPGALVISNGSVEQNRAMGLRSTVVLDPEHKAAAEFAANGTPMAVLIDANGRVASPLAVGADAVLELARADAPTAAQPG